MDHPVILFDGVCNYCNAMVNFVIRRDKKKLFRFAALQSAAGEKILQQYHLSSNSPASFLLIDGDNVYDRSSAALKLYNRLPWYWKWTQLGWIFPRFLRDGIYNIIARNRYK